MRDTRSHESLDERTQSILLAVVQNFIETADPVGSRTVSKRFDFGLSPATIRNVMSDLEDLGFLEQPHTSAGRVPTDLGYRCYVDHLRTLDIPNPEEAGLIVQHYEQRQRDSDEVLTLTSRLLSDLSNCASVILSTFATAVFKQIELVKVRGKQVMAIFVMESSITHSKLIMLDEDLTQDDLHQISNYLNWEFSGQPLHTIRHRVRERMAAEKAQYDQLAKQAMDVGMKSFDDPLETQGDIVLGGTSNIMDQPDFAANLDRMKELFRAFEEKQRLIRILDRCLDGNGLNVIIGSETPFPDVSECSFVTHTYSYDERTIGVLGIVGPKRMEYPRMMALVDYTANLVSRILTHG